MIHMPSSNLEATRRTEALLDSCLEIGERLFEVTAKSLKAFDNKADGCRLQPTFAEAAEHGKTTSFRFLGL
jgi:hypothetical protein